jgi:poly(ADP-ribose) glycohydrolase
VAFAVQSLDTISYTIRGSSGVSGDYGMLAACVQDPSNKFFSHVWPRVVFFALQLPACFPCCELGILEPGRELRLSRLQATCLVAHQFHCTLQALSWRSEYYDFSIWYDSSRRHPEAVKMYLNALFIYFKQSAGADDEMAVYSMSAFDKPGWLVSPDSGLIPLRKAEIIVVDDFSTQSQELNYQGPCGCTVISATKDVGFGQSATQEEILVGNCPEACPAVLVTPTLTDDQVLSIQGPNPMLGVNGQRRDITWSVLEPEARRGGRMLFMDALEIDELDDGEGLQDLRPDLIDREIKKAYTAFSSWECEKDSVVWTGIWGCGAFNGDPAVKMTLFGFQHH